ncbi:geranyl diphosphate 2-C-methyltransferase [Longispora albida]|uniref:geranyl diphosphate 2-C-methyltransferase n=1 Tax=Longispora albida TaxID=203523 RepID=UPI00035CAD8F|nr:geranyl diphosphate 2-C-methyltransferase [Longispora albida]
MTAVLRTAYQKSIAEYWDAERDPVNIRLGDVDGLYHHHYGIGEPDLSVLEGPAETREARIIEELHRLETAQAHLLLDQFEPREFGPQGFGQPGPLGASSRLMDAGSGRGGTSFLANQRFGCQVDGVSISQQQVDFASNQAVERGVDGQVQFHFRNMLDTGFPTGSMNGIWTNETTMYVDLFELYKEFSRLLAFGGRYVNITGCYNDLTGGRSKAVIQIDEKYTCNVHPRSAYFKALAANNLVPISVVDLTPHTIPYWELRQKSSVATGVEDPFLTAYKEGSFHYLMIIADKV